MALKQFTQVLFLLSFVCIFTDYSRGTYFVSDDELGMRALNVHVSVKPEMFKLFDKKVSKITIVLKHVSLVNYIELDRKSPFLFSYPFIRRLVQEENSVDERDRLNPHIMDKLNQKIELTPASPEGQKILIFNDVLLNRPIQIYAYILVQFCQLDSIRRQIQGRQGYYSDLSFFLDEIFEQYAVVLIPEVFSIKVESVGDNLSFQLQHDIDKSAKGGARKNVFSNTFRMLVDH